MRKCGCRKTEEIKLKKMEKDEKEEIKIIKKNKER